jgi:hypothetical protein
MILASVQYSRTVLLLVARERACTHVAGVSRGDPRRAVCLLRYTDVCLGALLQNNSRVLKINQLEWIHIRWGLALFAPPMEIQIRTLNRECRGDETNGMMRLPSSSIIGVVVAAYILEQRAEKY